MPSSYYAVIFSSQRNPGDEQEYAQVARRMEELAALQPGFLGIESVRDPNGAGITVSYWATLEAISSWKANSEHYDAQKLGRQKWYKSFMLKICRVEREYTSKG